MKKQLYIHAGMQKTGSTAIQFFCFKNISALKDRGICYPRPRAPTLYGHSDLFPEQKCYPSISDDQSDKLQIYIDEIRSSPCEAAILSSEDVQYFDLYIFERFKEEFDIHFIIYIRSMPFYLESLYRLEILSGSCVIIDGKQMTFPRQITYGTDWSFICKLCDIYGENFVNIRSYDDACSGNGLINDFLSCFSLDLNSDFSPPENVWVSFDLPLLHFISHLYMLPLSFCVRNQILNELSSFDEAALRWPKYRLLNDSCFEELTDLDMASANDAAKRAGNPSLHRDGLVKYKNILVYPHIQLPTDDQHFIFSMLSSDIQCAIQEVYPDAKEQDNTKAILPQLPEQELQGAIARYVYHYNKLTQELQRQEYKRQLHTDSLNRRISDLEQRIREDNAKIFSQFVINRYPLG